MDAALWYASECQKRPSKCQKSSSTRSVAQDTAVGEAFLCCCYFVIVLLFLNICVSIDKVRTGAQDAAVGGDDIQYMMPAPHMTFILLLAGEAL